MKIEIRNLGPISRFEFDLTKDLNIVFGQNNIGKSYAITAVYLIIKNLTSEAFTRRAFALNLFYLREYRIYDNEFYGEKQVQHIKGIEDSIEKRINASKKDELDITDSIESCLGKLIQDAIADNLANSFNNSFSSLDSLTNRLSKEKFSITLHYKEFSFSIYINKDKFIIDDVTINKKVILKKSTTSRKPLISDTKSVFYYREKQVTKGKKRIRFLDNIIEYYHNIFRIEVVSGINNIYFLPASRSGLYQALSTFSAVIAELSKSRNFLTHKIELPNISEPVSDYFLYLSNINSKKTNKRFTKVIKTIEELILEGEIIFNSESKKIVFSPKKLGVELDLSVTSSMISEIAPIVAFLKYIVSDQTFTNFDRHVGKRTNLIFIEEPEAHLHPLIQVKMIEIFSTLIKHNVKIVMTTHSNYILNKLSNLILEDKVNYKKVGSYLMNMTSKGSILDATTMQAEPDGIRDENFADVSETLYEERINIYENQNSLKNAD
jgi:predicted ATPase